MPIKSLISLRIYIAIYLVSLIIRSNIGLQTMPFSQDQARDVSLMATIQQANQFIIYLGPKTSIGDFYLPPLYYQINLLLSYITHNHPLTMMWFGVVIESLTPVLIYAILKQFIRAPTAVIPALLYAFSPYIVPFAIASWNPSTIPFWTTMAIWTSIRYIFHHEKKMLVLFFLAIGVSSHMHFQTAALFPIAALVFMLVLIVRRKDLPIAIAGILLSLFTLTTYIYGEYLHSWQNTQTIIHYFNSSHEQIYDRVSKMTYISSFLPDLFDRTLYSTNSPWKIFGYSTFFIGTIILVITSIARKDRKRLWLLIYLFSLIIAIRLYKGDKLDFYLSLLFVWPFILFGFILDNLKSTILMYSLFLILITAQILKWNRASISNQYQSYQQTAKQIISAVPDAKFKLWINSHEDVPSLTYFFQQANITPTDEEVDYLVVVCTKKIPCQINTWITNNMLTDKSDAEISASNPYEQVQYLENATHSIVVGRKKIPIN